MKVSCEKNFTLNIRTYNHPRIAVNISSTTFFASPKSISVCECGGHALARA